MNHRNTTVFENERYAVEETGRDYDFVASIRNKTGNNITLVMDAHIAEENGIENFIRIPADDWIGLVNWQYEGNYKQALEQGNYKAYTDEELAEAGIDDPYK